MSTPQPALAKGSLILVTGASGFIASHVVKEALALGYRVRGTARSEEKCQKTKDLFQSSDYETAIVAHMEAEDAFDEAMKGVDGIIHLASVVTFSPDPNQVIPQTIAGSTNILKSAMKESSVRRVVFTSSSSAATLPNPGEKKILNKDTWNDLALQLAWADPPYTAERAYPVYAASKTEAERAVWKFVDEQKPNYVVNCVLPNANIGRILSSTGGTGAWVTGLVKGDTPWEFPAQWMVDVIDDARIHVAALLDGDVTNERLFVFAHPYNWNTLLDAAQKVRPDLKYVKTHVDGQGEDLMEPDNKLGAELLKKWFGQDGYKPLEQSVKENLEGL